MVAPNIHHHGRPREFPQIGSRWSRLVIIEDLGVIRNKTHIRARCDCGNEIINTFSHLKNGMVQSCGCLHQEAIRDKTCKARKHSMCTTRTYHSWASMLARCTNPKHHSFRDYGERGITVCKEWQDSFENFFRDMGTRPTGTTLDRKDNEGPYCAQNCRWSTPREQSNNRRSSKPITFQGRTLSAPEWERLLGLGKNVLQMRLRTGWSIEEALTTPQQKRASHPLSQTHTPAIVPPVESLPQATD